MSIGDANTLSSEDIVEMGKLAAQLVERDGQGDPTGMAIRVLA